MTLIVLNFQTTIGAPPEAVWNAITDSETFSQWTRAFCEGSRFEGSWNTGDAIQFLDPSNNGMIAEIAESVPFEYLSIRHLGFVINGVPDTDSDDVLAWAPAYENYRLTSTNAGTTLDIEQQIIDQYVDMMKDRWPKALDLLQQICEQGQ